MSGQVAVVGAGVVGLCCALQLQRAGKEVVLLERDAPGEGCSSGNAGMIQTGSVMPLAMPGILGQLPGMLLDHRGALVIHARAVPAHWRWFWRLVRQATPTHAAASASHMAWLLSRASKAYDDLLDLARCGDLRVPRGELYVYRDEARYQAASAAKFAYYQAHSIAFEEIHGAALQAFEPALSRDYRFGYYVADSQFIKDPLRLSQALARAFVDRGGRLVKASVMAVQPLEGGRVRLLTSGSPLEVDSVVIANGASAPALAASLGVDLQILPMRGYHVMVDGVSEALRGPVISGEMNVAATPMLDGVRLAGTLEFVRDEATPPDWRRAEMLLPLCRAMLPGLGSQACGRWFGHRPGTPDSLPLIGPVPRAPRVWVAAGHGMLGLTLAAVTGELVAQGIDAPSPAPALAPFSVDRFTSRPLSAPGA